MASVGVKASNVTFDFDYHRFNGRGNRPSVVPSLEQADFIRSRYSVEEPLIEVALQRVRRWAEEQGISVNSRKPYPSKLEGRYWLEFHLGGLTL